jgi:peptide-methionine (R)-S-oxide reductase
MEKKKMPKTEEEWKERLSSDQYYILRKKGTEPAFAGKYWNNHEKGTYVCAGCGAELFSSDTKFDSGTGWPSFWKPEKDKNVKLIKDTSYGMERMEVVCAKCGGHLGHVFDDGPKPTGQRYCINSACLELKKKEK